MTDIEKRARELLAAEFEARGDLVQAMNIGRGGLSVMYGAEIAAIAKALTPPEGYVLVPVDSVKLCACGCHRYCCAHCGTELGGFAARPEVK